METLLSRRCFWFASAMLVFGAFAFTACDLLAPTADTSTADSGPGCSPLGSRCEAGGTPCCNPLKCTRANICDAEVPCVAVGGGCVHSTDCCGGAACVGIGGGLMRCSDGSQQGRGGPCQTSADCLGTLVCRNGACLD